MRQNYHTMKKQQTSKQTIQQLNLQNTTTKKFHSSPRQLQQLKINNKLVPLHFYQTLNSHHSTSQNENKLRPEIWGCTLPKDSRKSASCQKTMTFYSPQKIKSKRNTSKQQDSSCSMLLTYYLQRKKRFSQKQPIIFNFQEESHINIKSPKNVTNPQQDSCINNKVKNSNLKYQRGKNLNNNWRCKWSKRKTVRNYKNSFGFNTNSAIMNALETSYNISKQLEEVEVGNNEFTKYKTLEIGISRAKKEQDLNQSARLQKLKKQEKDKTQQKQFCEIQRVDVRIKINAKPFS